VRHRIHALALMLALSAAASSPNTRVDRYIAAHAGAVRLAIPEAPTFWRNPCHASRQAAWRPLAMDIQAGLSLVYLPIHSVFIRITAQTRIDYKNYSQRIFFAITL
jgi:hypothetical protein